MHLRKERQLCSEWPLPLLHCRLQLAPSGLALGGSRSRTIQQEEAEVGLYVHNTTSTETRLLMKSIVRRTETDAIGEPSQYCCTSADGVRCEWRTGLWGFGARGSGGRSFCWLTWVGKKVQDPQLPRNSMRRAATREGSVDAGRPKPGSPGEATAGWCV